MNLFISWFDYFFFDIKDNDNFNDKIYIEHCQMSFSTRLNPTTKTIIYYDSFRFIYFSLYLICKKLITKKDLNWVCFNVLKYCYKPLSNHKIEL